LYFIRKFIKNFQKGIIAFVIKLYQNQPRVEYLRILNCIILPNNKNINNKNKNKIIL